jgi:hypothetical protein
MGAIATALRDVKEERTPVEQSIRTLSTYIVVLVMGVVGSLQPLVSIADSILLKSSSSLWQRPCPRFQRDYPQW